MTNKNNAPKLHPSSVHQAKAMAAMIPIEATTKLQDGTTLSAARQGGVFSWKIDGMPVTLEVAQNAMVREIGIDSWTFTTATGESFEMRRPNAEQQAELDRQVEQREWNEKVEAARVEKKAAKWARKMLEDGKGLDLPPFQPTLAAGEELVTPEQERAWAESF